MLFVSSSQQKCENSVKKDKRDNKITIIKDKRDNKITIIKDKRDNKITIINRWHETILLCVLKSSFA